LQRIGAYALARLGGVSQPEALTPDAFQAATERMTRDAVKAALVRDSKHPDGYWLKCSHSFFPGSKMNHPSVTRKDDTTVATEVQQWRAQPPSESWPGAA